MDSFTYKLQVHGPRHPISGIDALAHPIIHLLNLFHLYNPWFNVNYCNLRFKKYLYESVES